MRDVTVTVFKATRKTNLFNKNQKLFVIFYSGSMCCKVCGKHRGKNKYISAWFDYGKTSHVTPDFKDILVGRDFAIRHGLRFSNITC